MNRLNRLFVSLVMIAALAYPASAGIILCGVNGQDPTTDPAAATSSQTQTTTDSTQAPTDSTQAAPSYSPLVVAEQAALSVVQGLMPII